MFSVVKLRDFFFFFYNVFTVVKIQNKKSRLIDFNAAKSYTEIHLKCTGIQSSSCKSEKALDK